MKRKELLNFLRNKSRDDLLKSLTEARHKLQDLKFKSAAGKIKDVKSIKKQKKMISQILTVLKLSQTANLSESSK